MSTEAASPNGADVADVEIPTKLPSDVGMDYVPLATMLATGQLAEADQVRVICFLQRLLSVQNCYRFASCEINCCNFMEFISEYFLDRFLYFFVFS